MVHSHPEVVLILCLVNPEESLLVCAPVVQGRVEHGEAEAELGGERSIGQASGVPQEIVR